MKQLYNDEDVARWSEIDKRELRVANDLPSDIPDRTARVLGRLSDAYRSMALSHLAYDTLVQAREALAMSVSYETEIFERFEGGEPINIQYINAGDFQSLLDALATGDWSVVERFNAVFPAEFDPRSRSVKSSLFIARPLKALVEGRIADAQQMLEEPEPKPEAMFRGYTDCLRAIADRDMPRFVAALGAAADGWRKWSSRNERGLPYAVCFLHGAGFVALAERIMGESVPATVQDVPFGLLHAP